MLKEAVIILLAFTVLVGYTDVLWLLVIVINHIILYILNTSVSRSTLEHSRIVADQKHRGRNAVKNEEKLRKYTKDFKSCTEHTQQVGCDHPTHRLYTFSS